MQRLKAVIGSTALALVTASSLASAQSQTHKLRGDFAFSGGATCLASPARTAVGLPPAGFTADLVPVRGTGIPLPFEFSFSVQGVRSFNGDGTGSVAARVVSLRLGASGPGVNPGGANAHEISGLFTYSVAADGTITIDQGPIDSVIVAGANAGDRNRISDIPTFVGRMSKDRDSLSFATFNPGVETVTDLGTGLVESVRICHRERTGVRISQ